MASTYLSYTQGTPTNNKKWTWSAWVKFTRTGEQYFMASYVDANNNTSIRFLDATGRLDFQNYVSGGDAGRLKTSRNLRDPSAWYHIVCVFDSDNVTSGDRQQIWINGVRETAFDTETYPSSGAASIINANTRVAELGRRSDNANMFDGEMSHVQFVDGLALAPTEFGETDATDGMWKIKTGSYATAGNNGYHLKMENSSNLDLDSSSNAHTFSTTGTLTATKDNPSNNFCTLNPLRKSTDGTNTFSNGNTIFSNTGGTQWHQSGGTLEATAGKYYYEADINYTPSSSNSQFGWGATEMQQITKNLNNPLGKLDVSGGAIVNYAPSTAFYDTGAYMSSTTSSHDNQANGSFAAATSGSVIMIAIDLDNGKFYVGKDGTWDSTSSSNPSAGSGGKSFTTGGFSYSPWVASYNGAAVRINFGNGYFGSSAIGSAVSAGEGLWKYTPPTNYGAFCTKNINSA